VRIALIEDHAVVRAGLRLLLEASGHEVVAEYGSAAEAEHLPEGLAEVAILDLALPDRPGLSLIPRLRRRAKAALRRAAAGGGAGRARPRTRAALPPGAAGGRAPEPGL